MSSSTIDVTLANATSVTVADGYLTASLEDGRRIWIPLSWYPRLFHASEVERQNFRLIGKGSGIHWEDLDENISIQGIIAGHQSQESQASQDRWIEGRRSSADR